MFLPRILETLAVSVVYVVTARLGQRAGKYKPGLDSLGHHDLMGHAARQVFAGRRISGAFAGNSWTYLDV